jgi:D-glycero-D-manno-heptose 1,7-bisphosphate phosphatase
LGIAPVGRVAVFLDRDGVLNEVRVGPDGISRPPQSVQALTLLPGVIDACEKLRRIGCLLVVVTNQPDVARGVQTVAAVEQINDELRHRLPIADIWVCYHDNGDGCACRKPQPGLLLAAARQLAIDLDSSFMVGDRWSDIEAGRRAGCRTILIGDSGIEHSLEADYAAASLAEAANWISDRLGDKRGLP